MKVIYFAYSEKETEECANMNQESKIKTEIAKIVDDG